MLEWNGTKLSQSMAICRFIAKEANLAGNTETFQKFDTIGSAVFTYFGYKQTDQQTIKINTVVLSMKTTFRFKLRFLISFLNKEKMLIDSFYDYVHLIHAV